MGADHREAIIKPLGMTDHQIILVADVMRRVISNVTHPEHDLCADQLPCWGSWVRGVCLVCSNVR